MNEFAKHLYKNDLDGYIQVMQIVNKNHETVRIYNTREKGIRQIIKEKENESDVFITPNTLYIPQRNTDNIRQFRALYVDIDSVKDNQVYTAYKIFEMAEKGQIPKPSMIVNSGSGIHLYWRIKNAPHSAKYTWQNIEDMLIYRLKKFGADSRVSDSSRVLRLPNTINSKSNTKASIMYIDNTIEYSMFDLKEKYVNQFKKKQINNAKKQNSKLINNVFFNTYSLHILRSNDILKLCELRNYDVKGHRNMILHCYAYWQGIYVRNEEELKDKVYELNSKFKQPLRESEVNGILRCIPKAIKRFIDYEQGLISGDVKRKTKGMKDKGGYWYKNETLIDRLNISIKEQEKLETIISKEIKYKRRNLKRTPRNEQGLTEKQSQDKILKQRAELLMSKGISYRMTARELKISLGKLQYILQK